MRRICPRRCRRRVGEGRVGAGVLWSGDVGGVGAA